MYPALGTRKTTISNSKSSVKVQIKNSVNNTQIEFLGHMQEQHVGKKLNSISYKTCDTSMGSKSAPPLLKNSEASFCLFCYERLAPEQGVLLQDCHHTYCRECLQFAIKMQKESMEIPCPVWYFLNCGGFLNDSEVRQLVSQELYQEYIDRSLLVARKQMKNVFTCQTRGCGGWCEFEADRKTFVCPLCSQINCLRCTVIHSYRETCEQYQSNMTNQSSHTCPGNNAREETTSGWAQLVEMVKLTGDIRYHEKQDLLVNNREFPCPICFCDIDPGQGVILHECLHMFCRDCLIRMVECNEEVEVKCPWVEGTTNCWCFLQPREIKALVPPHVYEKHLQRSVQQGESSSENSFHCRTPNCPGWCLYDEGAIHFQCPRCRRINCIQCQAIHEGMNCWDYRNRVQQNQNDELSEQVVEEMIRMGQAMRCPRCRIPVQKVAGCDWLRCAACKTEICWVTRGPRWGPRGRGDTSGGWRCSPWQRCHPHCGGCH